MCSDRETELGNAAERAILIASFADHLFINKVLRLRAFAILRLSIRASRRHVLSPRR